MEEILSGDYFAHGRLPGTKPFELQGPTIIRGGRWIRAMINTNDHSLVIRYGGNYRGLEIDGEQNPDNWPPNVHLETELPSDTAVYTWKKKRPIDESDSLHNALAVDPLDNYKAFIAVVRWIHIQPSDVTETEFLQWYSMRGHSIYSKQLIRRMADSFNVEGWPGIRDFINSHTVAQLKGEATEIEEEI